MTHSTDGIILKKNDSGEADAIFTIYTKDFGKLRALAQGVKKEGAKLKGHLEPLNLASVSFVLGKNGERLTRARLLNHWPAIRSNWKKLRRAYAILEMVDQNTMAGDKDEKLWELIVRSLDTLAYGGPEEDFLKKFEEGLVIILQPQ